MLTGLKWIMQRSFRCHVLGILDGTWRFLFNHCLDPKPEFRTIHLLLVPSRPSSGGVWLEEYRYSYGLYE